MSTDTCPDCGAPVSERVDVSRHWKCGSRPAGLDYGASRSWACQELERRREALEAHLLEEAEQHAMDLKGKPDEIWEQGAMHALRDVAKVAGIDFSKAWQHYEQKREAVRRDVP